MNCCVNHLALNCKNLDATVRSGSAPIQLIEAANASGINHYGFVADDMDQTGAALRAKNA